MKNQAEKSLNMVDYLQLIKTKNIKFALKILMDHKKSSLLILLPLMNPKKPKI